jgi:chemotaxis protein methyltransferase CheR
MTEYLSHSSLARLSEFIADRMGFHFPRERWLDLERGMRSASRAFGFEDVESCVQGLVSSPVTRRQIEILASHLSVGETYFFRERQTFAVLEARVLAELINRRRDTGRRLRIWSAGCCTGEEPYSIAILLKRMLPDLEDWHITVLATDINPQFLQKAADGIYGEWSFRGVPAELKERYFAKRHNGRFEILPEIKGIVTFSYLNLMEDTYPSLLNNTNAMDIIFCRNVLMYFGSEQAKNVVHKLHLSLLDGGWLIVSPCETSHVLFEQFAAVSFPATILYRKDNHIPERLPSGLAARTYLPLESMPSLSFSATPEPEIPTAELPDEPVGLDVTEPKGTKPEEALYGKSLLLYEQGFYEEAAQILVTLVAQDPNDAKAAALLARVYANQGKLAEASRCSEQAVAADRLNPSCHILQATILQEQGAIPEAIRALQRALYLEPNLILAHFALGNMARRQEKIREAARHFDNARTLLGACAPEQVLPEFDGITAGRLMEIIRSTHGAPVSAVDPIRRIKPSASAPDKLLRKGVKVEIQDD